MIKMSDTTVLILFGLAWFVLMRFVLPRFGVPT